MMNNKLPYKNIIVNEITHFQDMEFQSCYISIEDLNIFSMNSLTANVMVKVYKTKQISIDHPDWTIQLAEIPTMIAVQIGEMFTSGSLLVKISEEVKNSLLRKNPTWSADNILIEE